MTTGWGQLYRDHVEALVMLGLGRMPECLWTKVAETLAPQVPELAAAAEPYELFRARFSRRSRDQMRAWGTDLSAEQLDEVCIFGPREDDQPVPA